MSGGHEDFGGAQSHSIVMQLQKLGSTKFSSSKHSSNSRDPVEWEISKWQEALKPVMLTTCLKGEGGHLSALEYDVPPIHECPDCISFQ
jgi:hypothetical protein